MGRDMARDMAELVGKEVQLQFEMRNAELFSFWFDAVECTS